MPTPVLDYVEEINGVFAISMFDPTISRQVLSRFRQSSKWGTAKVDIASQPGEFVSVTDPDFRSANVLFESDDPAAFTEVNARIKGVIKPLAREIWELDLEIGEGTQIVRYQPGGHYKAHADAQWDLESRYFAVLIYLNDDFEGGGTSFPYLGNHVVRPRQGKAVLFPARYVHCAEEVTSGEKFVAITFLHGPPSIKWL